MLGLAACASQQSPVVVERSLTGAAPSTHVVAAGETLYSIALRYEKDYQALARLNHLDEHFTLHPGQRLRLSGSLPRVTPPAARPGALARPRVVAKPAPAQPPVAVDKTPVTKTQPPLTAGAQAEVRDPSPAGQPPAWTWPAKGPLVGRFGVGGVTGKGLDIAGKRGDSVRAAASGVVVYAGSALVGYGRLLIIRHDDNYISAYAHNDRFLVKEGDRVQPGQVIAEMGASGADREKLHFEIRERGTPVDPLRYLPARE